MKKGRIRIGLLALAMIFQFTSCGAATETADAVMMNKGMAPEEVRTAASTVYYDGGTAAEAEFGFAADYSTADHAAPGSAAGTSATADANGVNDLSARKIIKNATIRYETKTYDEFLTEMSACIRQHGAYIESEESYGGSTYDYYSTRSAYLTVRVPLDTYDAFMSQACTIGSVTYKSENSTDVTMAYVDTESRIKSLETEYDALLAILEKATKLEDVISLQSRISEVTYELETYKAQLRKYDDLISYCTVNIDVNEVEKVTPNVREMTFGEKLRDGLTETFEDIADDASEFALWFVTSLPYFIIWGVVLTAAVLLLRLMIVRYRKRRVQKMIDRQLKQMQQKQADSEQYETNEPNQTNS